MRHPKDCLLCNAPDITVHYYTPPESVPTWQATPGHSATGCTTSARPGDYCPSAYETATGRLVRLDRKTARWHDSAHGITNTKD